MAKETRICFVASSGGHLDEVRALQKVIKKYPCVLITEGQPYKIEFYEKPIYCLRQMNRKEIKSYINLFTAYRRAREIFITEKTTCVITTGAMCAIPCCLAAKRLGIPVIYLESFARIKKPSMTGMILYMLHLSSLFLIQWPGLKKYYPKSKYEGSLF